MLTKSVNSQVASVPHRSHEINNSQMFLSLVNPYQSLVAVLFRYSLLWICSVLLRLLSYFLSYALPLVCKRSFFYRFTFEYSQEWDARR